MKHVLFTVLLYSSVAVAYAQKADSLLRILPTTSDTQRVQTLNELCMEYIYSEPETAKRFVTEALQLAISLDYNIGRAKALNRLGIIYDVTGKYDSSISCYQHAGVYYARASNIKGKASTINNIGMLYAATGRFQRALSNYFVALKIFETIHDETNTANCLNNIAIVYMETKAYHTSLRFLKPAARIYKQTNNLTGLASCYTNMGLAFGYLNRMDSCLFYYHKALQIEKRQDNIYGLSIVYNDLGIVYQSRGESQKAMSHLLESLKYKRILNDKTGEASTLLNISGSYHDMNESALEEKYLLKSHLIALDINSYRILRKTGKELSRFYLRKKDYRKALAYMDIANRAEDSVLTAESAKQIAELQLKYDSEKQKLEIDKKTLELTNANLDISRKRSVIVGLVIVSGLIVLIAVLLYSRYRHKKQRELDAELLHQQELRNKAIIDAEDKERIRIARELHDGIGQQLSAVKMNLSALDADLKLADPQKQNRMNTMLNLIDGAVREVRMVSHDMMPNALLHSGFVSAVKDLVAQINAAHPLKIGLQVVGLDKRLENTTETTLYRILQECISNILKHSQASQVNIQLIRHDTHINLLIEDNGRGFDTGKMGSAEGIGLRNIISRVQYLSGTVSFDSTPGNGTTVIIDIPA